MNQTNQKRSFFSRRVLWGATVGSALVFFIAGIIVWGGFNTAMEATHELEFCVSCHEMEVNVYEEYTPTIHYSNRTGVRAVCSDCHVPKSWGHKMVRKIKASKEVFYWLTGKIDTPEKFDAHRLDLAKNVWKTMKETDSRECRNCHNLESMNPEFQRPRARKQHLNAFKTGQTCIDCHKGIAHKSVRDLLTDEELDALEAPNPDYIRDVPAMFIAGLKNIEIAEAKQTEKAKQDKEREQQVRSASKEAEDNRIKEAVAAALATQAAHLAAQNATAIGTPEVSTTPASDTDSAGFGLDWANVPSREITVFYPGQASMEWVLNGRDHGGARAFVKSGDTCASCHDQETAAMGEKIVSGEVAEPTPIPGKRGSIPVNVQAAHDNTNLYLRFEWQDTGHVAVPFVEGGKMDPENQVKLAVMLSDNQLEYAQQAGCWGTCHHDARTMPDTPDADALVDNEATSRLAMAEGITKYVKESRTSIEVKGRRGKKRGGWDKLKTSDEFSAAMGENQIMDLLRYQIDTGITEDGYIYEQRLMTGGQGFEANSRKQGDMWIVEMKRALSSDNEGDLSMVTDQRYNLGFAIHDDYSNARFHHVSLGYNIGFDDEEADINAVKREPSTAAAENTTAAISATSATSVGAAADSASTTNGSSIDWSKAGSRDITLFYPGQTSMEWVLNGRDHGGARAFVKSGDTCASCHDQETAAMGEKIVSGEIAEPTPIPGKRGSIPVVVQATSDAENLYLKFEWDDTAHAPVPFVEGGKMDPDNPMKIAIMFSNDELEFADRAGCWGACHHDARTMPDAPDADTITAYESADRLDLTQGVSKYLKESRDSIEIRGKRGKKRGGWDKLKPAEDIQAAIDARQLFDLLRYQSGSGLTEDGYVYDQRVMQGGQGFEVSSRNVGGHWTVEMTRKLVSDQPTDISFDRTKTYNFGFAIHDDYSDARFHHVSLGYKMGFDNAEVDLNAKSQ
jgi:nitrate/TMAO reductase-like tetraheme cytochrome c subunit